MNEENVINEVEEKESFISLYTRLYNENFEELERLRKKESTTIAKWLLPFALIIIGSSVFTPLCFFGLLIAVGMMITTIVKACKRKVTVNEKSYKEVFKEKIITPVIKNAIPESEYFPYEGISKIEYARGKWEGYDRYSSDDKLIVPLKLANNETAKLCISEVHTENMHEDDEGNVSYSTVFHGMCGYINLPKNLNGYIKVKKNGFNLFGNKNRVKMDMSEFEKVFDVESDDKIKAMQLLTSDVMYDMLDIVKKYKTKFEMYIVNDVMHIRFHTGAMFEPEIFGKAMQLDNLKKYFDLTTMVQKTVTDICNVVIETEI